MFTTDVTSGGVPINGQFARGLQDELVPQGDWSLHGDNLEVNTRFLESGLLVVKYAPSYYEGSLPAMSDEQRCSFFLGNRTLVFDSFATGDRRKNKTFQLYLKLQGQKFHKVQKDELQIISNKHRRDELFFPLSFEDQQKNRVGFYVFPWGSQGGVDASNIRFNRFATAICMLGPSLVGVDQNKYETSLIKHGLELLSGQFIKSVTYQDAFGSYEQALFVEFNHLLSMMHHLSVPNQKSECVVHLPGFDYLLFAYDLVIARRMTLGAFKQMCRIMAEKSMEYKTKIENLFNGHAFGSAARLIVQSPFENIFGTYEDYANKNTTQVSELVLERLGFNLKKFEDAKDETPEQRAINQESFVKHCVKLLQENRRNPEHKDVWMDVLATNEGEKLSTMEDLLRLANGMMVAYASRGLAEDKTCSLLPVSEKQIQLTHEKLSHCNMGRDGIKQPYYSDTVYITYVDPVITYQEPEDFIGQQSGSMRDLSSREVQLSKRGLLFYFNRSQRALESLMKQGNVLSMAHSSVGVVLNCLKPAQSLASILRPKGSVIPTEVATASQQLSPLLTFSSLAASNTFPSSVKSGATSRSLAVSPLTLPSDNPDESGLPLDSGSLPLPQDGGIRTRVEAWNGRVLSSSYNPKAKVFENGLVTTLARSQSLDSLNKTFRV